MMNVRGKISKWCDYIVSVYHRKIAKDRVDDEGLVINPDGITDMPRDGEVTYSSETGQALILYQQQKDHGELYAEPVYLCGERPGELPGSKRAWD